MTLTLRILTPIAVVIAALYLSACAVGASLETRLLYQPSAAAVDPDRPDTSLVFITTEDGETLRAWWRPPEPGRPVLLYLGGNGDRPEIEGGRWRRIADYGGGFLALCYRGYSGSTGEPSEPGLHADASAAYDWLMAQGVEPEDLVIHGFSLGTGPATRLAMERDAHALVLEAPYTSIDDIVAERMPVLIPWRWVVHNRFPSREWIGDVDEPVLIVHGDADTVIPFAQGERLFGLAREPKRFVRMEGSDHATLTRDGIYEHIWSFLEEVDAEAATPTAHGGD
jgi:fermentation-respiration switch protein FrsA (DUF1100 family)